MKRIILAIFILVLMCMQVNAKSVKSNINDILNQSGIDKHSVSVSVKSVENGKVIYSHNDKILMHPASVQKMLILPAIVEVLGDDYEFETSIYSRGEDSYLIKLGADPYLSSSDLKRLVRNIDSKKVKQIYIDDSLLEGKSWGEGWQWDDDLNISMPKFNSYNLDGNILKFTVMPTTTGDKTFIINPSKYPLVFINNVITSDKNQVNVSREPLSGFNTITLDGKVVSPYQVKVPVNNLKQYFDFKLTQALGDRNIYLKTPYVYSPAANKDVLLEKQVHPISTAISDVLLNSNNMVAEILSKIAGAKVYGLSGTDEKGLKVVEDFYKKNGIDTSRVRFVDASGVSKNNLADADFVTEYLVKMKDNKTLASMAVPGVGTLSDRMIPLGDNLKAKTGTLSDISSIAGYLTTKSGHKYAFCIITNDPKSSFSDKKGLEDYLLRELYLRI